MKAPCGSASWLSRYRENSEQHRKSSVAKQCCISPCKYSDNRPREYSNARHDYIYSSAVQYKYTTIAARYGANTFCPLTRPYAKLLQPLPRTCTPWAATRLSSAAVAKTSNASYSTTVRQGTYVTLTKSQQPAGC